jgi:hypothetical protein
VTLWVLLLMLVLPVVAQGGLDRCDQINRTSWLIFFCLIAVAATIRNPWAALCVAMIAAGMLTVIPKSDVWIRAGLPSLAAAAAYAALTPKVTVAHVEPVLWAFVAVGCYMGFWTDYSRQQGLTSYMHWFPRAPRPGMWFPPLAFHEDSPTHLKAGQGNANHLQSAAVLSLAAMLALVFLGRWWALLAWPLVLQPLLRRVNKEGRLGQGHLHAATLLVTALGVWSGKLSVLILLLTTYTLILCLWARPWQARKNWYDGGRFGMWRTVMVDGWAKTTIRQKLLGLGTGIWQPYTAPLTMPKHGGVIFTAAHNEYLQWLVEHGIVGLILLSCYVIDALGRLWNGGQEGHSFLLVALTLLSVAVTNFPWTWFHSIERPPECQTCKKPLVSLPGQPKHPAECHCEMPQVQPVTPYYVGSPALNAMSLVIAILVEAF